MRSYAFTLIMALNYAIKSLLEIRCLGSLDLTFLTASDRDLYNYALLRPHCALHPCALRSFRRAPRLFHGGCPFTLGRDACKAQVELHPGDSWITGSLGHPPNGTTIDLHVSPWLNRQTSFIYALQEDSQFGSPNRVLFTTPRLNV